MLAVSLEYCCNGSFRRAALLLSGEAGGSCRPSGAAAEPSALMPLLGAQVDLLGKGAEQRLDLLEAKLCSIAGFDKVYRVSAMNGTGVAELRADLVARHVHGASLLVGP